MKNLDFLDEELNQPSVFEDESKLSTEFLPDKLLFREDQLTTIVRQFKSIFGKNPISKNLIIYGDIGTGKTSISKKFGIWALKKDTEIEVNLHYTHVNCRKNKTMYTILLQIAKDLNSHVPSRGYSAQELLGTIIEILEVQNLSLILVLDEIEYVSADQLSDLIYYLTRTKDDKSESNHDVALILITRRLMFLNSLDKSTKSTLNATTVELPPYSVSQLYQIISERVSDSFKPGVITDESLQLVADIAGKTGDARQALELLWFAGKYADKIGSSTIYPDYIRSAQSNTQSGVLRNLINSLNKHQMFVLLAISRQLQFTKLAYVTTGEVKEEYQIICEENQEKPRQHTQIWQYLKTLQNYGIIETKISGQGQKGTTTCISIHDYPMDILKKEVSKQLTNFN